MKTHLDFESEDFPAYPNEDELVNPGCYGKRLAEFLAAELPKHGFNVRCICNEDWGWMVELENEDFPLWIGCANHEAEENTFRCFIEPSKPVIRKWFSKIDTTEVVSKLGADLEAILIQSGRVINLRWWSEDEVRI